MAAHRTARPAVTHSSIHPLYSSLPLGDLVFRTNSLSFCLTLLRTHNKQCTDYSGNWMWASKLPGECARMYDACSALREALLACGVGIDGGKVST
jgi:hypothetical protein